MLLTANSPLLDISTHHSHNLKTQVENSLSHLRTPLDRTYIVIPKTPIRALQALVEMCGKLDEPGREHCIQMKTATKPGLEKIR
jgi:hypothetical protein